MRSSIPLNLRSAWNSVPCMAYDPGVDINYVVFSLSAALQKAEAVKQFECKVFEGDIRRAFDELEIDVTEEALRFWQIDPWV